MTVAPPTALEDAPSASVGARFVHRPALDGLRGIAVLAVVVYHLGYPWARGGFLGVDAFFVLSGFLITSLLLVERGRTGRNSLPAFWSRRFRRLFPALVVLLLTVTAVTWITHDPGAPSIRGDGLATLFYVANWHLIITQQSYFAELATASPLRHTWSLAIEEQFYLVFPLVVVALLARRRSPVVLGVVAAIGAVVSALAMALLSGNTTLAYYDTGSRVHELLVGVVLAVLLRPGRGARALQLPARVGRGLALGALCLIAVAFVTMRDQSWLYYHGGSLLFSVVVAALILGLEFAGPSTAGRLLTNRPLVAVGLVSYGLYLWHWPFQLWIDDGALGLHGVAVDGLRVAAALAATIASYWLVERPIRTGRALRRATSPRLLAVTLPVTLAVVATIIVAGTRLTGDAAAEAAQEQGWSSESDRGQFTVYGSTEPGAPTVAVVGDSIARSVLPGLDQAGKALGVRIIGAAWSGCGMGAGYTLDMTTLQPVPPAAECAAAVPSRFPALIKEYHPQVVWWYSTRERFPQRGPDGQPLLPRTSAADAAVMAQYETDVKDLTADGAKILISPVVTPSQRYKGTCKSEPDRVGCKADDGTSGEFSHLNVLLQQLADRYPSKVRLVDMGPFVCPTGPPCATFVDGIMLRYDGYHFTAKAQPYVGPRLLQLIVSASGIRPLHPDRAG